MTGVAVETPAENAALADPSADQAGWAHARETFEFATDALFETNGHGVILQANYAAAVLTGRLKEFLVGKPLGLLLTEGSRSAFYQSLARLRRGFAAESFEARIDRRGDGPREVVVTAYAGDGDVGPAAGRTFRWLARDVTFRVRAEADRAGLLRSIVTAQEEERRRIARELHDSLGQYVAGLSLGLQAARDEAGPAAADRLDRMVSLAREMAQEVHRIALELRPSSLDDIGLEGALQNYVEQWSRRAGVRAEFAAARLDEVALPAELSTAVYRVVQEALTNVLKYARASQVSVIVEYRDDHLFALVEDDGQGFDTAAVLTAPRKTGGLGIVGMRERVALFGGTFQIESSFGGGTTVFVRIPLPLPGGIS